MPADLPIQAICKDVLLALQQHHSAIVKASPGAGKTTVLPLYLLEQLALAGKKILLLQPRRLATKAVAQRLASNLNQTVGKDIGYQMRQDSHSNANNKLIVMTEAVLLRHIQKDPTLSDVGLVIFDEFHERNLDGDIALMQCRDILELGELKLLVMSATLALDDVATFLPSAPLLQCEARSYPIQLLFKPKPAQTPLPGFLLQTVLNQLGSTTGDVLVFLPGKYEIINLEQSLKQHLADKPALLWQVRTLYGGLDLNQHTDLFTANDNCQRIILATNIAETSVTLAGVNCVIDSGLHRVAGYDWRRDCSNLRTQLVAAANAKQRMGRAGRTQPGTCIRLWSQEQDARLSAQSPAQIDHADLSSCLLALIAWGEAHPHKLQWITPPSKGALAHALDKLQAMQAIVSRDNKRFRLTEHGNAINRWPLDPALAHMIENADQLDATFTALTLAALLMENLPAQPRQGIDLSHQLGKLTPNSAAWQQALRWSRAQGISPPQRIEADLAGALLSFAYPQFIGKSISGQRFQLNNGMSLNIDNANFPYVVLSGVHGEAANSRARALASVDLSVLIQLHPQLHHREQLINWDKNQARVNCFMVEKFDQLRLSQQNQRGEPEQIAACLGKGISQLGINCLPWQSQQRNLLARLRYAAQQDTQLPACDEIWLQHNIEQWLVPFLVGINKLADISTTMLQQALENIFDYRQQQRLNKLTPTKFTSPNGNGYVINYDDVASPTVSLPLHALYGLNQQPMLGQTPLRLCMQSPAGRPIQISQDLPNFWQTSYHEVRKDMRANYPRHYWPEQPASADATSHSLSKHNPSSRKP